MNKYYHQDVYRLETGQTFEDKETMHEWVRDNWELYCQPVGDEVKLLSMQDTNSEIVLEYFQREFGEDGEPALENKSTEFIRYEITNLTWLISKLERMTANV